MAADSWNLVKSATLKKTWTKILNKEKNDGGLEESSKENEECKTIKEMGRILSYEENEINEWLNSIHDPGYPILNDEIQGEKENEEIINECFENDSGPSHNETFESLETTMKWLERQNDTDPIQLTGIRRIRDMETLKKMSSLKQATIKSFFA